MIERYAFTMPFAQHAQNLGIQPQNHVRLRPLKTRKNPAICFSLSTTQGWDLLPRCCPCCLHHKNRGVLGRKDLMWTILKHTNLFSRCSAIWGARTELFYVLERKRNFAEDFAEVPQTRARCCLVDEYPSEFCFVREPNPLLTNALTNSF